MKIEKLKQYHNIAILWYGKEGKSALNFLKKLEIEKITVLDKNEILEREDWIFYETGENYLQNLEKFDLIIKTPWISPYVNNLLQYKEKLTSTIEIFLNNYKWKVIGLTWTKWKSTTSTVLYSTLQNAWYKVKLVWNIWTPVLDEVDILSNENYDYIVFEMSSYMLEWLKAQLYIWYLNNLYICHYDWHFWGENYNNAKKNILKIARKKIANIQTQEKLWFLWKVKYFWEGTNIYYKDEKFFIDSEVVLEDKNFLLEGLHNRINICGILAILNQISADYFGSNWVFFRLIQWLKQTLENFNWLPHRIQNIWTYKWITFIDDAIATTPDSTMAAMKTFWEKIWTLFLWGQDSWFDFSKMIDLIGESEIKNLVLFPDTWLKIFWDLSSFDFDKEFTLEIWWKIFNAFKTKTMEEAVKFAYKNTEKWKICLLSTASPSFSVWKSYVEKWTLFQEFVKKYWE